jgi:hypothetical protein
MTGLAVPDDSIREAVLTAFRTAEQEGRSVHECYLAAVIAYRRLYPEYAHEPAARRAVDIILETKQDKLLRVD